MKYLIPIFILSACGPDVECERYVAGICFDGNGWNVDEDMVNNTVSSVQKAVSQYYCPTCEYQQTYRDLNLRNLAHNRGLRAEFVDVLSPRDCSNDVDCMGYYVDDYIAVQKSLVPKYRARQAEYMNCLYDYYVLGHELLHFVEIRWLEVDQKQASAHMTPHFFFQWAMDKGESVDEVAEDQIYIDASDACEFYYWIDDEEEDET